jgi:hypothetical protein
MSVEQEKVIDILASGKKTNEVELIITDHLSWDENENPEHLNILQNKINSYLEFIESGELIEKYPEHKGKLAIIKVKGMYPLNEVAKQFYKKSSRAVAFAGFLLVFEEATGKSNERMKTDFELIHKLLKYGAKSEDVLLFDFLFIGNGEDLEKLNTELSQQGFAKHQNQTKPHSLLLIKKIKLEEIMAYKIVSELEKIAEKYKVKFDGWGTEVKPV